MPETPETRQLRIVEGLLSELGVGDIEVIRNSPIRRLLRGTETRQQLELIAAVRGYRAGWVWHVLQERTALAVSRGTSR